MIKASTRLQELRGKIYSKAKTDRLLGDWWICLAEKGSGKPYEGKPHVRFDEKMLEIGYGCDIVTSQRKRRETGNTNISLLPLCQCFPQFLLTNLEKNHIF